MQTEDKAIKCTDCEQDFVWTVSEQRWYKDKCFDPPKRCPFCRRERRRKIKETASRREVQNGR